MSTLALSGSPEEPSALCPGLLLARAWQVRRLMLLEASTHRTAWAVHHVLMCTIYEFVLLLQIMEKKILIILGVFLLHYLSIINFLNVVGLRVSHPSLFCVSNTFQRHTGWKLFCTQGAILPVLSSLLYSCYTSRVHYFILYKFLKFKHVFFCFYFAMATESVYNTSS